MSNLFGIYTGIVIDSTGYQDSISKEGTRFIGHVRVKINGVTPALFSESFKSIPASNVDSVMDIRTAANTEVLAYVMQPLMGSSTPGVYDSASNTASPMRKNAARTFKFFSDKLRDSSSDGPKKYLTPVNNPYGNNYYPNYPWNTGLGSYSIPEVNTSVLVGFLNGLRNIPIVLGKLPKQDELESFYQRDGAYVSAPGKSQNYNFGKPDSINEGDTTQNNNSNANNITTVAKNVTSNAINLAKRSVGFIDKIKNIKP